MLVRAPTHLFSVLGKWCGRLGIKMIPLLVGDFAAGNAGLSFSFPKKQVVQSLNWWVDKKERSYLQGNNVLVNSKALAEKYRPRPTNGP